MHISLIVVYTERLEDCRAFYAGLGLSFVKEQHGAGPEHYAATLDGVVFELYPATSRPATGSLRLGFTVPVDAVAPLPAPGRHVLVDPDGRSVDLCVT
ncbi:VOC family protein [Streptosporangium sp. NPDC002607]